MGDLISRQMAIDAIRNIRATTGTHDDEILLIDKAEAQTELMLLPTAERKGHWENYLKNGLRYKCSVCGSRYNLAWNYCPRCGARMESE